MEWTMEFRKRLTTLSITYMYLALLCSQLFQSNPQLCLALKSKGSKVTCIIISSNGRMLANQDSPAIKEIPLKSDRVERDKSNSESQQCHFLPLKTGTVPAIPGVSSGLHGARTFMKVPNCCLTEYYSYSWLDCVAAFTYDMNSCIIAHGCLKGTSVHSAQTPCPLYAVPLKPGARVPEHLCTLEYSVAPWQLHMVFFSKLSKYN